jgi:hypothetical protein
MEPLTGMLTALEEIAYYSVAQDNGLPSWRGGAMNIRSSAAADRYSASVSADE